MNIYIKALRLWNQIAGHQCLAVHLPDLPLPIWRRILLRFTDYLQRTIGNKAVLRLMCCKTSSDSGRAGIQTKLTVSQPGDIYEQEADRVAEQVMRMSSEQDDFSPTLRMNEEIVDRKCQKCEDEEEETNMKISRRAIDDAGLGISENVEQHVSNAMHKGGFPLDPITRDFMETRFGYNFSDVRIHTDDRLYSIC